MLALFRTVFTPPRDLILLLVAGWLGLMLAERRAKHSAIGEKNFENVTYGGLIVFIVGGRVLFLVEHAAAFLQSPASLFSVNAALFDVWGATACGVLSATVIMQRRRLPVWAVLDLLAPVLATLAIGLSLSHLASGAAFGSEAQLPWSIELWGAMRHPTQIYELIAAVASLCIIWYWRGKTKPGSRFLLWVALAAGSRLIIEGFRGDSTLVLGGVRLAQIIAWVILASALIGLELLKARQEPTSETAPVPTVRG